MSDHFIYDRNNQTPEILPISRVTSAYGDKFTELNKKDETWLTDIYRSHPAVSSMIDKLKMYIFKAGVDLEASTPSSKWIMNTEDPVIKNWRDLEILPALEAMFVEWMLYGYTCVLIAKSKYNPALRTISIIPREEMKQLMRFNQKFQREYMVKAIDATYGKTGNGVFTNAHMLCLYPPTANGDLDSPVIRCRRVIVMSEALRVYHTAAVYRNVYRPYIFSSQEIATSRQHVSGTDNVIDAGRLVEASGMGSQPFNMVEEQYSNSVTDSLENLQEKSRLHRLRVRASQGYSALNRATLPEIRAIENFDPIDNEYETLPGRTLQRDSDIRLPTDLTERINEVQIELAKAFGIPPALDQVVSDNAASVESVNTIIRDTTLRYQKQIQPIYESLLSLVVAKITVKDVYNQEVRDDSSKNTDVNKSSEVRDNIRVKLTFGHAPTMSLETAMLYYDSGIITEEAVQNMALSIGGLPQSYKRPDMAAFIKKRFEMEHPKKDNSPSSSSKTKTKKKKKTKTTTEKPKKKKARKD
jgi:hypothetical protein